MVLQAILTGWVNRFFSFRLPSRKSSNAMVLAKYRVPGLTRWDSPVPFHSHYYILNDLIPII